MILRFSLLSSVAFGAGALAATPAFPGAEGAAMFTSGGRGGNVIAVTNLNDSGPGSLRAAVEAKGSRIVVFRVAGTIPLASPLRISHGNITIAGQSAPGGGICLRNYGLDFSRARNVIVRYLRVRPGDGAREELDAIRGSDCQDVIVDHCSASWSVDETVSIYKARRITVQWCIISESLFKSAHKKGEHGFGGIWGGTEASWHHNLIAHHTSRNPRIAKGERSLDIRNNFIFNWGYNTIYGGEGSEVNVIGNYFLPGPATRRDCEARIVDASGKKSEWFVHSNVIAGFPKFDRNNWDAVFSPWSEDRKKVRSGRRFDCAPVRLDDARVAADRVLESAGATLPERDSVDRRIVAEASSGKAKNGKSFDGGKNGIIDHPEQVGGWPLLRPATAPRDSDSDGMPDAWENRWKLDPADPEDGKRDSDGDG
ncbi:MAG: polysaccharide lyase family 1 protein, partial [Saprospiraceae bacterium]